jgi:uncharacterized protein (TIGR00290 family)
LKTALSWSTGKDSAWALHILRSQGIEVSKLLTTVNSTHDRVAMHAVRRELLEAQAEAVEAPLMVLDLPWPCTNEMYEAHMQAALDTLIEEGFRQIAFGDLFLRDIRTYREEKMASLSIKPIFPLWDSPTKNLANEMIAGGLKARITCIDPAKLDARFAGRQWDKSLIEELPRSVDPCGENGEFHTFAYDGPMFSHPLKVRTGQTIERDGFIFTDIAMEEKEISIMEEEAIIL